MKLSLKKVAVLSCVIVLLPACQRAGTKQASPDKTIPVTLLHGASIDLPRSYVADVQAIQFVEIKPKVEGFVEDVLVDEGEFVKKGQPLFRLSAAGYAEALKEAESNYKQTQAQLEMAKYEMERISRLVEKQILSSIRLVQAEREYDVARMRVEQAHAQMQRAQMDYSYTTILSPFTGYVDRIPYKTGSLVNPESLLTTVSDISEVFAYYRVNESEYLRLRRAQLEGENLQQRDSVELVLPDGTVYAYRGRQETVEGDFERGTGSIAFRVRFPNPDGLLKHGVTGKIRMMTHMEDVCLIPQKSTFEIQDFTYVYLIDKESKTQVRSFHPIERYQNYYVTQDFPEGTAIVYEGVQMVRDGMKIETDTIPFEEVKKELKLNPVQK